MPQPLVILWCQDRIVLTGSANSPCWSSACPGDRRVADTIRFWKEEFPEHDAARLIAIDEDPASMAEAAAAASRSGRRLEGAWPLECLLGRGRLRPCLDVVAVGGTAMVRVETSASPPHDVWCRQFYGSDVGKVVRTEIQEVLARVEEGATVQCTLTSEDCPWTEAWRTALHAGTTLEELALESLLDRARQLEPGRNGDRLFIKRIRVLRWLRRSRPLCAGVITSLGLAVVASWWLYRRHAAAHDAERAAWSRGMAAERRLKTLQEARRAASQLPPPMEFPFLSALASAVPPAIFLESIRVNGESFSIAGSVVSGADDPNAAERLRRSLFAPGASWREDPGSRSATGLSIALSGSFLPNREERQNQLITADAFAAELTSWGAGWRIDRPKGDASAEDPAGLVDARYHMTRVNLGPSAWAAVLGLARRLASVPGLTIDRMAIDGTPAADGSFTRLEVDLTARLLPPGGGLGAPSVPRLRRLLPGH